MNYALIYEKIVSRARSRILEGYKEKHHIIPRCLGGDNSDNNLVNLTPEEHFLVHLLLVKIYPYTNSLIYAANSMCRGHKGKRANRRMYGWLKRRFSIARSQDSANSRNSQFGRYWITNGVEVKRINKDELIPAGWVRGKTLNKCRQCGKFVSTKTAKMCNECRKIERSANGKKNSKYLGGKGPLSYTGRHFITNGSIDKLIQLTEDIPVGWRKGRSQNKHIGK